MAAAWQATGTLAATTGADVTPTLPAHQKDDVLILVTWRRGASDSVTVDSSWTAITSQGLTGYTIFYWKRAQSDSETAPLCDWSSATGDKFAVVHCFRGCVRVGSPVDMAQRISTESSTDPGSFVAARTNTYADSLVVFLATLIDDVATGMNITGDVAPTTLTTNDFQTTTVGSDGGCGIATGSKVASSAITLSWDFTGGAPGNFVAQLFFLISDNGGSLSGPARWQESGAIAASTGADITPTIPTHQANDLLLLVAMARTTGLTCATPAGWTSCGTLSSGGVAFANPTATATQTFWWFYRIAMSGAETNPLCDFSSVTGDKYALVHVFRGTSGFENTESYASDSTPGASLAVASLTANPLMISLGISSDNTATAVSISADVAPSSLTQRSYTTTATGADAGAWASSDIMSGATPGADVTIVHTFTGAAAGIGLMYAMLGSAPFSLALPQPSSRRIARLLSFRDE